MSWSCKYYCKVEIQEIKSTSVNDESEKCIYPSSLCNSMYNSYINATLVKQLEGFNLFFSRYIYPSFVFLKFYHLSCMYLSNCLLLLHSIIFPSQAFSCHSNDHQLLNPRIHTFCRTLPLPSLSRDHENQVASLSFKSDASEIPVSM